MYWDPTYAKWMFRERSANYFPVTLRQVAPSWCNLCHKVSTSVKLFLILFKSYSFFLFSFSWPPFGKLCTSFPEKLQIGSQWNFTCMLMDRVQEVLQNIVDLHEWPWLSRSARSCFWGQGIRWCHLFWPMVLTFQGHDLCKSHFRPYLSY